MLITIAAALFVGLAIFATIILAWHLIVFVFRPVGRWLAQRRPTTHHDWQWEYSMEQATKGYALLAAILLMLYFTFIKN